MSGGPVRDELAEPIAFESVSYGVVCGGPGGCGALVATSQQDRHRAWHRTLAGLIPRARDAAD